MQSIVIETEVPQNVEEQLLEIPSNASFSKKVLRIVILSGSVLLIFMGVSLILINLTS